MFTTVQNIDELWQAALEKIESQISRPSFETWLKNTQAVALNDDILTINVLNEFAKDWLEGRYTKLIQEVLFEITGSHLNVQFILPEKKKEDAEKKAVEKLDKYNSKQRYKNIMQEV